MTESNSLPSTDLLANLEALLFVASEPVSINQLANTLNLTSQEVHAGIEQLAEHYRLSGGLSIQWNGERIQLTTAARMGPLIERFLELDLSSRLSKAALETLAIICYEQPITRPKIDSIRGVSSDGVIKSLLSKALIQEVGRAEGPGRPIMYGTTSEFLQYFGLNSIKDLPPLELSAENQKILKD